MIGIRELPAKSLGQLAVLATRPGKFFENLYYTYDQRAYQQKLRSDLDVRRSVDPAVKIDPDLAAHPTLNVMLPEISRKEMTGGPNTAIHLASQLAASGIRIRLVSAETAIPPDADWFWRHLRLLTGTGSERARITVATCSDPQAPMPIGVNDIFLATYWATAHSVQRCLGLTNCKEFLYLIQDFEPAFFPWSSNYALALETYDMNFRAIINEATLAEYFRCGRLGRFADPAFMARCVTFEPAVDAEHFYSVDRQSSEPRRLLFYARPGRNMMAIGYDALCLATGHPAFDGNWEFIAIGARAPVELDLSNGKRLRQAPWMTYSEYAKLLRESDVLLCLMFSPHTSYPTLEMVACGGIVVTNTFATKTRERLLELSPNFVPVAPNTQAVAHGLIEAAQRVRDGFPQPAPFTMPRSWDASLAPVTAKVKEMFAEYAAKAPTR